MSGASCGIVHKPVWNPPERTHNISGSSLLDELWVRSDIYIPNVTVLGLAASNGEVFFLGGINDEGDDINALDVLTGKPVWVVSDNTPNTLFASKDALYVGMPARISKLNAQTGELQWSRDFWNAGGVRYMLVYEDRLHIVFSPDKHRILKPSDGITILSVFDEFPPFFESNVCGAIDQTPLYTNNIIYFRSEYFQVICALDISTGSVLWKSKSKIISNVVAKGNAVFGLIESGELIAFDSTTGKEISTLNISFDNKPFVIYPEEGVPVPYFLAFDDKNSILLLYLGDTANYSLLG
jgi:outer membrane protein assembly factor BamB